MSPCRPPGRRQVAVLIVLARTRPREPAATTDRVAARFHDPFAFVIAVRGRYPTRARCGTVAIAPIGWPAKREECSREVGDAARSSNLQVARLVAKKTGSSGC